MSELFRASAVGWAGNYAAPESHPRCGYRSKHLWAKQGRAGAGKMLTPLPHAWSRGRQAGRISAMAHRRRRRRDQGGLRPHPRRGHVLSQEHRGRLLAERPSDRHRHRADRAAAAVDGRIRYLPAVRRLLAVLLLHEAVGAAYGELPCRRRQGDQCLGGLVCRLHLAGLSAGLHDGRPREEPVG